MTKAHPIQNRMPKQAACRSSGPPEGWRSRSGDSRAGAGWCSVPDLPKEFLEQEIHSLPHSIHRVAGRLHPLWLLTPVGYLDSRPDACLQLSHQRPQLLIEYASAHSSKCVPKPRSVWATQRVLAAATRRSPPCWRAPGCRHLPTEPSGPHGILERQDGVSLEGGPLIGELLAPKRLLRLPLSAAGHLLSKDHPNSGDQRSRHHSQSTSKSTDDGGVGHVGLWVGCMVTTLDDAFREGNPLISHILESMQGSHPDAAVYKTVVNRPAGTAECCPCSSRRVGRPGSAGLSCGVARGGMTSRMRLSHR
jgi:hypothetical protein